MSHAQDTGGHQAQDDPLTDLLNDAVLVLEAVIVYPHQQEDNITRVNTARRNLVRAIQMREAELGERTRRDPGAHLGAVEG